MVNGKLMHVCNSFSMAQYVLTSTDRVTCKQQVFGALKAIHTAFTNGISYTNFIQEDPLEWDRLWMHFIIYSVVWYGLGNSSYLQELVTEHNTLEHLYCINCMNKAKWNSNLADYFFLTSVGHFYRFRLRIDTNKKVDKCGWENKPLMLIFFRKPNSFGCLRFPQP